MPPPTKPNNGLEIVPIPAPRELPTIDYPHSDIPVPDDDGNPSALTLPVQYLPWADTVPRHELREAMEHADTPKALRFLAALSDPLRGDLPVSVLAGQCGIRVPELVDIWRRHRQVAAMAVAISQAPAVALDTVEDAKSRTVCCSRCDGAGTIRVTREFGMEWITCQTCAGSGFMRKTGDAKSREWVLRAAGVIAADPGVTIINNQNNTRIAESVLDDLEQIDRMTVETVAIPDDDA